MEEAWKDHSLRTKCTVRAPNYLLQFLWTDIESMYNIAAITITAVFRGYRNCHSDV